MLVPSLDQQGRDLPRLGFFLFRFCGRKCSAARLSPNVSKRATRRFQQPCEAAGRNVGSGVRADFHSRSTTAIPWRTSATPIGCCSTSSAAEGSDAGRFSVHRRSPSPASENLHNMRHCRRGTPRMKIADFRNKICRNQTWRLFAMRIRMRQPKQKKTGSSGDPPGALVGGHRFTSS